MEDPVGVPTPVSSEDSDDSLPLSQFANKKTVGAAKLTKKGKEKKPRKRKKKDPNEPQKPVSAYALFFRDTQAAIKGQKPNASFGEVSKIVASMWDSLDAESKETYKKRTETAKKEYLKKLAAYRASVISQQTPDQAYNECNEVIEDATDEDDKPVGKKAKMDSPPIVISSASEVEESNTTTTQSGMISNPSFLQPMVSASGDAPATSTSSAQSLGLKGQTIQIPRSLLEQAANKPISITVTQASGDSGGQTKVIKVMVPERELQKLQKMKSGGMPQLTTQAVTQTVTQTVTQVAPVVVSHPEGQVQPITMSVPEQVDLSTVATENRLANDAAPEPVAMTTPEATQPIALCEYNGCNNQAIESPLWDNEYCSNQCVVNHCQDVFTAWVAARSGSY